MEDQVKHAQIQNSLLYKSLLDNQYLTVDILDQAKKDAESQKISLYEALLRRDAISDENIGRVLADIYKTPFVVLSKTPIKTEILHVIPQVVATKQKIITFDKDGTGLKVATIYPDNKEMLDFIAKKSGDKVVPYFATERDIADAAHLYNKDLQKTFDDLIKEQVSKAGSLSAKDVPIAEIVDLLIAYAYQNKTSDIHIEPQGNDTLVRFRIDGVLHDVARVPHTLHDQIVTRIKVLSRLRTDEHLSAQDGKMQVKLPQEDLDIRVSIVPIVEGEKVVMRLLSSRSRQFSLSDLGMQEQDLQKVQNAFKKPYGMVLSTGPTGSGKSTTIYAILKIINTREKNIATIEDPVEYDIPGINQIQVNAKSNLTFAAGLRSILRQDPDTIFVGEIRDEETAGIAVNSAMTGHLVLSTLHTNNAATTIPRLSDMKVEPFLVASTVNAIIAQRLIRKICEKCRYSEEVEPKYFLDTVDKAIYDKHLGRAQKVRIYKGKGCDVCHNTGYLGRIGIFEVLETSPEIRKLIVSKAQADEIEKKAAEQGMTTMLEDGLAKVQQGLTTLDEILRVTKS